MYIKILDNMADNETKIVIAGFGGQGVVLAGNIITQACMLEGTNVTMMVSYGAEMRGGTANSSVVISDTEISSPVIEHPDIAIIMNQPSLEKFEPKISKDGQMIINTSLVETFPKRADIRTASIQATQIAQILGNVRIANMVALGAFAKYSSLIRLESLCKVVEETFAKKKPKLVDINITALHKGFENIES